MSGHLIDGKHVNQIRDGYKALNKPSRLAAREKVEHAIALRKQGMKYSEIGPALGYKNGHHIAAMVEKYLKEHAPKNLVEYRIDLTQRLEELYQVIEPKAMKGDFKAIEIAKGLIREIAALNGLVVSDATKLKSVTQNNTTINLSHVRLKWSRHRNRRLRL